VEFTQSIADASGVPTIASGGVRDESDIDNLEKAGNVAGVIIGKAFYEGTIDLNKVFKVHSK
jgi:phosphoribosylformimino-5-aminoimidazole carboxamide ribotide isomerase